MRPTLKEILDATLVELNMTQRDYKRACNSRLSKIVLAKQIVCYAGKHFGYTHHQIADFLKMDLSNVPYHYNKARDYSQIEKGYATKLNKVLSHFGNVTYQHSKFGWVARDRDNGLLTFFMSEPTECDGSWHAECYQYGLPIDYFPQVSYEDSPRRCEVVFRLK